MPDPIKTRHARALAAGLALLAMPRAVIAEDCAKTPPEGRPACYEKALDAVLAGHGTEAALAAVEAYAKLDPIALREAHPLTHHVGRRSFAHYQDAREALSHCRDVFSAGCYHGVLEGYLASLPEVAPRDIVSLCEDPGVAKRNQFAKFNCVHGLGHGLAINFQHDTLKSLAFCDALATTWDRESCYGGVFMELIVSYQGQIKHGAHAHHRGFLNPDDAHYPCSAVASRYLGACYLMQSSAILTFTGHDFGKAFAECDRAPEKWVGICYQSMGRDVSGYTLRDVTKTIKLCRLGQRPRDCLIGAVKDFILTYSDPERGLALCRELETGFKAGCYETVGETLLSLYPEAGPRHEACGRSEPAFVAACKGAAQLP